MKAGTRDLCSMLILLLTVACGRTSTANVEPDIDPRGTVVVPEGLEGEDSIAYIESKVVVSPISVADYLGLSEVHTLEGWCANYNNFEQAEEHPEFADCYLATHRDSAAMRLANRFMRMYYLARENGKGSDVLRWAEAVNAAIDTFRVAVPELPRDSVINEIERVMVKFSSWTQWEMNGQAYISASVDYYRTVEAYRQWVAAVPAGLKSLALEEFEAWNDLNKARFDFWNKVSYTQSWYSAKPLEIEGYYSCLVRNRRAELEQERAVVLRGDVYRQQGSTVTTQQWEDWIAKKSVPEDYDLLVDIGNEDRLPSDSLVAERVSTLKSTFAVWLAARQALAAALPEEQGTSYDNITADIHCRMIGMLHHLIPFNF